MSGGNIKESLLVRQEFDWFGLTYLGGRVAMCGVAVLSYIHRFG